MKRFIKLRSIVSALLLVSAVLCNGYSNPIVENHPQRDLIMRSLQRQVDEHGSGSDQHFFFLKRKDGDWVYWREGRLLWKTDFDPYYEKKGPTEVRARAIWDLRLFAPWKPIELDTDVVASESDLHPPDWHVTKDYVARIVYDCVLDGELVTVHPRSSIASVTPLQPNVSKPSAKKSGP